VHSPIRVLLVSGSYPPMHCGVGDYTERLAIAFTRHTSLDVRVLTSATSAPQRPANRDPVRRIISTWHVKGMHHIAAAMRRISPDIVHLQFPTQGYKVLNGPALIPCLARTLLRVPVVVTCHEYLDMPKPLSKQACYLYAMAACASAIVVVRPDYAARISGPMKRVLGKTPLRFIANTSAIPTVVLSPEERNVVREELGCGTRKLIVYFGFSYPHKGVDLLFRIADPARHHVVLIGDLSPSDSYHAHLLELAGSAQWKGHATVTGFLDVNSVARLLAAADAAVFPFRNGGGIWNSSLHAAANQGTFVLTTSAEKNGYDADANIYFAPLDGVAVMRNALSQYEGTRREAKTAVEDPWLATVRAHEELYLSLLRPDFRPS
jgi:glycosyltransferase involved in cell wall biosynthesis